MGAAILTATILFLLVLLWPALRAYRKFGGVRLVTCPETGKPAAVEVDAGQAAVSSILGGEDLRLQGCSRWPERSGCGQECLAQIEASPVDCLVHTILTKWYADKTCALCRAPLGEINWMGHKPAVVDPTTADRVTREWKGVAAEQVPAVLASHAPICWNCHIAETFRRLHPELVLDREPGASLTRP